MIMRYVLYIVLMTALWACSKKTDELFDEPADVRLEKALDAYKTTLMQAPGWKLFVYPQGLASQNIEVGGLTYYVRFPDSNRTVMVSDFILDMAATPKESSYRLKAAQLPSLIFDTYSYIHVAADPDEIVSFSPANAGGYGWGTDFDFGFTRLEAGDSMTLKGNFNGSTAYLLRATEEEMNAAFSGQLANIMDATQQYAASNSFLFFNSTDNAKIGVSFNLFLYRMNFTYLDGGSLVTTSAPFSHTINGIHFKDPVTVGGYTFQDLYWDDALNVYYIDAPGGRVNITNSSEPLFPFNVAIGRLISTVTIPTTPLPGRSELFDTVYAHLQSNLFDSPFGLDLGEIRFIFDDTSKTMALIIVVFQDGTQFQAQYLYSYSYDQNGAADFVLMDFNGIADQLWDYTAEFRSYIEGHKFIMDYFPTGSQLLGQFTSQNNSDFFFTGTLQ
jgi:hypothetical protein